MMDGSDREVKIQRVFEGLLIFFIERPLSAKAAAEESDILKRKTMVLKYLHIQLWHDLG